MKTFIFWLDSGAYTPYRGETLGRAIDRFVKDGLHDICRVTRIEEMVTKTAERATS